MITHEKIRIGTLVAGNPDENAPSVARYLEQILPHGFESISLTFWQTLGSTRLRELAGEVNAVLNGTGVVVSNIGIFGNPLGREAIDQETADGWERLIDAADLFHTDLVTGFAGRVPGRPIPDSLPAFAKVFGRLADRAAANGVRLAFENCSMEGTWASGEWNIAHNPAAWSLMFETLPNENLGLQWEPCHQLVQLIDPIPTLRKWVHRVFSVHGKDATVNWDLIREFGIHGNEQWCHHRTPGFGDSNWSDIITILRQAGYEGSIDIEGWHDPVYKEELEMTGQVHALNHLKQCRGGTFVPNPA
jgi:sugar phosphate isomerase/epimerase